jgi:mRNA interferase HigB
VHIISRKPLEAFCKTHADARSALGAWSSEASKAQWKDLDDIQKTYRNSAEAVGNFTVFNIKGNKYRLIVDIVYASQTIFIKYILTHVDYDKGDGKNDPYF